MPPSIWFTTPSGLTDLAGVDRRDRAHHAHLPGRRSTLDLGDDRAVAAEVLVLANAIAAAARPSLLRARLPARALRAVASITARARGSFMWRSRNSTGSAPAAAASSSMNDSSANTLA